VSTYQTRIQKTHGRPMGASLFFIAALLALVMRLPAQLRVSGDMVIERTVKIGETLTIKYTLVNDGVEAAVASLSLSDYRQRGNTDYYLSAGSLPMSAALWCQLPASTVSVAGRSQAVLELIATVPVGTPAGTYNLMLFVTPVNIQAILSRKFTAGANLSVRYGLQVILTVGKPLGEAKVLKSTVVNNELQVEIENVGTGLSRWRLSSTELGSSEAGVYPGSSRFYTFDVKSLSDGMHKVRFILDDGADSVKVLWLEFRKGAEPAPPLSLSTIMNRQRPQTVQAHLNFLASYGNHNRQVNFNGSLNYKAFSLSAYSYMALYGNQLVSVYNVNSSVRLGTFQFGIGRAWYGLQTMTSASASFYRNRTSVNVQFLAEYGLATMSVAQTIGKNFQLVIYGNHNFHTSRNEYSAQVSVPIF